jgi:hypothetical protein
MKIVSEHRRLKQLSYYRKYRLSAKGKATKHRYLKRARKRPETRAKIYARWYVNRALHSGKLVRPDQCQNKKCRKKCKPEAHHESYEKCDWLKVQWLCTECHEMADARLARKRLRSGLQASNKRAYSGK